MKIKYRKDPLHKDVKKVRKLQKQIFFKVLNLSEISKEDKNKSVEEFIAEKLAKNPEKLAELQDELEEFNYIATIILATGLEPEEIEKLSEEQFWEVYEKSKEALGGKTAEDFLSRYTNVTSLMQAKTSLESPTLSSQMEENSPDQLKEPSRVKK